MFGIGAAVIAAMLMAGCAKAGAVPPPALHSWAMDPLTGMGPLPGTAVKGVGSCAMPNMRPPPTERKYTSAAVNSIITQYTPQFKDPNMAALFANALPNTLDTTVWRYVEQDASAGGKPDAFVVTGDIHAMWLRDSTNQVMPYLNWAGNDTGIKKLVAGLIGRQVRSVLIDSHANAFNMNASGWAGPNQGDQTTTGSYAGTRVNAMNPAIFERKYELDSLCNVLRLSVAYYAATHDVAPFDAQWVQAVGVMLGTMTEQQKSTADDVGSPDYVFQRAALNPTDSLEHGIGNPAAYTGMIKSAFRGSDDATTFPFNIPENAFAVVSLRAVAKLLTVVGQPALSKSASSLAATVDAAIQAHGTMVHPTKGKVYAYEVDGFGNAIFMDDANVPSLLALPYIGYVAANDTLYLATRAAVLSAANPYYFSGSAASGVGGPHNGYGWVWPMSIISQAMTSTSTAEIGSCLSTLLASSSCSGLIHESFSKDGFGSFTRPWFAWANSYFADLVLRVIHTDPGLLLKADSPAVLSHKAQRAGAGATGARPTARGAAPLLDLVARLR